MNTKTTLLIGPVLNRSGYGQWSNDIFHSLNTPETNLVVQPTAWGLCVPQTQVKERDKVILKHLLKAPLKNTPELTVTIDIPKPDGPLVGRKNVLISCVVETSKAPCYMVDNLNRYNLCIVPSDYVNEVLNNSDVKPKIPIVTVYWGADTTVFCPDAAPCPSIDAQLASIPEKELFLYSGQVTHPNLFCDRKDMDNLVKTFCTAFEGKGDIGLLLKVSGTNFSLFDRNAILDRINAVRGDSNVPVYLLHGELTDNELAYLYAHPKVIASISFTHGESFGMHTLHGSLSGKPVFTTNCTANREIIKEPLFLLDGENKEIPPVVVSEFFPAGSKWFCVDTAKATERLLDFYDNRQPYVEAAKREAKQNAQFFSLEKMQYRLNKALN